MNHRCLALLVLAAAALARPGVAENWPGFRGPTSQGLSAETALPLHWNETSNVLWKTTVPGEGWGSPVVWNDAVFVTSTLDSGARCHILRLDRDTGRVVWDREVFEQVPLRKEGKNSYATPHPVHRRPARLRRLQRRQRGRLELRRLPGLDQPGSSILQPPRLGRLAPALQRAFHHALRREHPRHPGRQTTPRSPTKNASAGRSPGTNPSSPPWTPAPAAGSGPASAANPASPTSPPWSWARGPKPRL